MATTAGIKDLVFSTGVDGGAAAPSATVTTGSSILGTTIDLFDTVNDLLPDEVALRIGVSMFTAGTPPQAGNAAPTFQVHAEWLTAATPGSPTGLDQESDLLLVLVETATVTGVTSGSSYFVGPTNPRIFASKGRYLRLKYSITRAADIAGNLRFGVDWAGIFGKTEG